MLGNSEGDAGSSSQKVVRVRPQPRPQTQPLGEVSSADCALSAVTLDLDADERERSKSQSEGAASFQNRQSRVTFIMNESEDSGKDALGGNVTVQDSGDDVGGLFNNDAVQALAVNDKQRLDIQRYLEELGVIQSLVNQSLNATPNFERSNSRVSGNSSANGTGSHPTTPLPVVPSSRPSVVELSQDSKKIEGPAQSGKESNAPHPVKEASRNSMGAMGMPSVASRRDEEKELMRRFFGEIGPTYTLREQHMMLGSVMEHIFCEEAMDVSARMMSSASRGASFLATSSWSSSAAAQRCCLHCSMFERLLSNKRVMAVRRVARRIAGRQSFTGAFLLLTLYSLFSNDLFSLMAPRDVDPIILIVNTAVFFAFVLELVIVMLANRNYPCTVPFYLDMIALFSVFNDTWFLREGGVLSENDQASRLSRMARTSKMTRLARIARVARITKLIPKLLSFFRRRNNTLAKVLILRRLWRIYLYMTSDTDGLMSALDIKIFYITVLAECPHMQKRTRAQLLTSDVENIAAAMMNEDQMNPQYTFDQFAAIIQSSELGVDMAQFHQETVDQESGVWSLTQKLSDTTAMKVCVGILILVCMIAFLEIIVEDRTAKQTLAQLSYLAQLKLAAGASPPEMCEEVKMYVDKVLSVFGHKVLYVRLAGYTFWDVALGGCTSPPLEESYASVLIRKDMVIDELRLREDEILWECLPNCQAAQIASAILADRSAEVQHQSVMALLTIVMAIVLLLIFVYVLNLKINMFSGNLLSPLRTLVDDMQAMSCLELVHIDEDLPAEKAKPVQIPEELESLQSAFKAMRSAIRSWSRYVPSCVVERLYASGTEATIGVVKCTATILFVDIDGFQDKCIDLPPNDVLKLLENVFNIIATIIQKQSGTLLEFIADEVLAVFNTPRVIRHHSLAGLKAAQQIHVHVNSKAMLVREDGEEVFVNCRVGVHTSNILAGNIGSVRRMKYGLLGDGINQTARIKGLTSRYRAGTLCTDRVLLEDNSLATKFVCTRPVDRVAVKGKQEPTTVYEVLLPNQGREWQVEAAKKHHEAFKLYQSQDFEAARQLFSEVNSTFDTHGEEDHPSRLLLTRCERFIDNPPPADWDGVDRLKTKSFKSAAEDADRKMQAKYSKERLPEAVVHSSTIMLTPGKGITSRDLETPEVYTSIEGNPAFGPRQEARELPVPGRGTSAISVCSCCSADVATAESD